VKRKKHESEVIRLGAIIRFLRLEKKFTQAHLSTLCDVDVRTIQRIEKGEQNLSFSLLLSIANSLDIRLDTLIAKIFE